MTRRLAITKKVSLEGISEGWTNECYAIVTSVTFPEYKAFTTLSEDMSRNEQIRYQTTFVKKHFIKGRIQILTDKDEAELVDMEAGDIDLSLDLNNALFVGITGITYDPKGSAEVPESTSQLANSNTTTATS